MHAVHPIDLRHARKEDFSTCWDFAFKKMTEKVVFSA